MSMDVDWTCALFGVSEMNKLIVSGLSAIALACSALPAHASVSIDAGTTVSTTSVSGTPESFSFGYAGTGTDSPFTQLLNWTNTLAASTSITLSGIGDIDITTVLLTGTGLGAGISLPQLLNNPDTFSLSNQNLLAGSYTLAVTGTRGTSGSFGGNVSASALPEPGTWAMMLMGFGFIGYAMRRNRSKVTTRVHYSMA